MVINEIVRRNTFTTEQSTYKLLAALRHATTLFPKELSSTIVVTARKSAPLDKDALRAGCDVITIPDIRWKRCDIKSVALLPNILGKQHAREAGAFEAWQIDNEGFVTEGTSTNAWIVHKMES